ncbi:hypothetical protein DDE74_16750 [Streptomyces lydicus]|uniref:Uncharacterized protein n=1 Tax=Streptomyces lydicus TaxID=47763 RepID=A0A3S9YBL0_9ACTN|nr:hypothetical protein DDE74_16750 [Streptomyces lydicus]
MGARRRQGPLTLLPSGLWRCAIAFAPKGAAAWLMTACYLPLLAWGPLLGWVTVAYCRRRRKAG